MNQRWVFVCGCVCVWKRSGNCLFIKLSPFSTWLLFFVTRTTAYVLSQKQTLECMLSTCKVLPQSVHKQTHKASLNVATLLVDKLPRQPQASTVATLRHCRPKRVQFHPETTDSTSMGPTPTRSRNFTLSLKEPPNFSTASVTAVNRVDRASFCFSLFGNRVQFNKKGSKQLTLSMPKKIVPLACDSFLPQKVSRTGSP